VLEVTARSAADVLLHHLHRRDTLTIIEKARMDYASEADEQAEAAIIKTLRRAEPGHTILGEEGGAQPGAHGASRHTWVIDPLDGTSNYLHGIAHWCVSIALCEDGEPIHAVVFDPLHDELFTAAQLDCIKTLLHEAEDVRCGGSSALDLAHIACGRLDGCFEAGVQPWDMAAGVLLVREAGGRVCDFGGAPSASLHVPGERQMLAGNRRVADALQALVGGSVYARVFSA